ncbi:hypothetical protein NFI96_024369, partial [Prochilodus magdalenae]
MSSLLSVPQSSFLFSHSSSLLPIPWSRLLSTSPVCSQAALWRTENNYCVSQHIEE